MEKTPEFLRRLCRFNDEVRQVIARTAAPSPATRERFAACEDAERDLRGASERREEAERALRVAERLAEAARSAWQEAEIDQRIARANAEAQVWAFIAQSEETTRMQLLWNDPAAAKPTWQAPATRPALTNQFFSIARVHDNTYRFFTIAHR
ncbi:MAG: hypothetical protein H8F28_13640 [Fibrella sp.]|nr:hypothetical protein [Armatimonadota bacterium]